MTVPLSRHAPRQVRHSLEARYADAMDRSLLDDIQLMASEIATNSVQHSDRADGDPLAMRSSLVGGVFRVELKDRGSAVQPLEPRSTDPPSGLGLVERLSDRWGSNNGSCHVWFEIDVTLFRTTPVI